MDAWREIHRQNTGQHDAFSDVQTVQREEEQGCTEARKEAGEERRSLIANDPLGSLKD